MPFFNSASAFHNLSSVGRQMLLRCFFVEINIIIPRDFSYLVYVCIYTEDSTSTILIYINNKQDVNVVKLKQINITIIIFT